MVIIIQHLGSLGSGRGEPVGESLERSQWKASLGAHCVKESPETLWGTEGQNSDFRVWTCEKEGVGEGELTLQRTGERKGAEAREDSGVCP